MEDSFLFVDSAAVDGPLRKRIRRHVMAGRNAGKTFHRRSRLELVHDVDRVTSKQRRFGSSEDKQGFTNNKEILPIMNDRNFTNPFRSLSFRWEPTAGALDILDECWL
jgi:hypothetical protein